MVNSLKPLDQNFYPIYPLTSKRGYYQKEIAIVYYNKLFSAEQGNSEIRES